MARSTTELRATAPNRERFAFARIGAGLSGAIAPERDPGFEVWGVTIRVLSVALLAVMIGQLLGARRQRDAG